MKEDLEKYIVAEEDSILDVVRQINIGARGIAFVCRNNQLLAAITDGDIRRFIIDKGDLTEPISTIANYHPHFMYYYDKDAISYMKKLVITALPVLNEKREIIDIKFLIDNKQQIYEQLNIPVVIMAGGQGTRLRPFTDILPKPLIPIGDKTITEHIMEHFMEYGCSDFKMIVNYKKNFIKAYFSDQYEREDEARKISFVDENEYLGTGGGLRLLLGQIQGTFFMTNCDILIEADYSKILKYHQENENLITMVCVRKNVIIPYGIVEINKFNQAIEINEKPQFDFNTNTGFYILESEFLDRIQEDTFIHITDIIRECIVSKEKVGVYLIEEDQWMDMGQMEELESMKEKMGL